MIQRRDLELSELTVVSQPEAIAGQMGLSSALKQLRVEVLSNFGIGYSALGSGCSSEGVQLLCGQGNLKIGDELEKES